MTDKPTAHEQFSVELDGNPTWLVRFVDFVTFKKRKKPWPGTCDHGDKIIDVRNDLGPRDRFYTLLHESLHAEFKDLSEDAVTRASNNILRLLEAAKCLNDTEPTEDAGNAQKPTSPTGA